jgi:hypothetical protein
MPMRSITACDRVLTVVVKATISCRPGSLKPKSRDAAAASHA